MPWYAQLHIFKNWRYVTLEINPSIVFTRLGGASARSYTLLPPLGSRVQVSVTCGFLGGWNRIWVGFSRGFSIFPYHKFHSTISPHSFPPFHFISPVMVWQAWLASIDLQYRGFIASHAWNWPCVGYELRMLYSRFEAITSGVVIPSHM